MAKPTFAKMNLKLNPEVKTITLYDQEVEVKQYIPIEDELELIGDVINQEEASDSNKFLNIVKLKMFFDLEIVFYFSNIVFTDKQKENLPKLYDLLDYNSVIEEVAAAMPEGLYEGLWNDTLNMADRVYAQTNSAFGILDSISTDYSNLNLDIDGLRDKLASAENLDIVKDIVTKLG